MENNISYIHMGLSFFDKLIFRKIKNLPGWTKPLGGLWASSSNYNFSWKDWLLSEGYLYSDDTTFGKYSKSYFQFKLNTNKILSIRSKDDLDRIMQKYEDIDNSISSKFKCLDFEKLSKDYDAIEVLISSDHRLYTELMGWDCDSILIFNSDIIEVVNE